MSSESPADGVDYRLAPALVTRLVGVYLVLLAIVIFGFTAIVAVASAPADLLVVLLVVGLLGLFGGAGWLRAKAYVVHLDEHGYRVGLVRGAGVKRARWADVQDAVAAHPRGIACLVLRLHDGTTTTIPVEALAVDRDRFAADVKFRLDHAARRRG